MNKPVHYLIFLIFLFSKNAVPQDSNKITFISQRDGNMEIYIMNDDGTNQTRITNTASMEFDLAWSLDGTKLAYSTNVNGNFDIFYMEVINIETTEFGTPIQITNGISMAMSPSWSPDGTKIIFQGNINGNLGIYIYDFITNENTELDISPIEGSQPDWSPIDNSIAFASLEGLYTIEADGSNLQQLTTENSLVPDWSPNGQQIAFVGVNNAEDIFTINRDGTGKVQITTNLDNDFTPCWSPDGDKITYKESQMNINEVCIINKDGSGFLKLTNTGSNNQPAWYPGSSDIPDKSEYFGQNPPGLIPIEFNGLNENSSIIEGNYNFFNNGTECLFTRIGGNYTQGAIMYSTLEDGVWLEPVISDFSVDYDDFEPMISPNEDKIFFNSFRSTQDEIEGAFLNQTFPSTTVTRFAPDIFTEEFHSPPIFSPDGTEVYWSWMDTELRNIQYMKLIEGIWTQPASVPFGFTEGSDSPFITSDGNKLVFIFGHFSGEVMGKVCIVEKNNGEWMSPQVLGNEVNQNGAHWQASMGDNQNLYFATNDIYFSEYVNGEYSTAEKLGSMINTDEALESCPFIASDESYLIFSRTMPNLYSDLFISFKKDDGSWGEAVNMEELNGAYHELYANVSPDGRFIMFLKSTWDGLLPHWVDASIIENYRNKTSTKLKKSNPTSGIWYSEKTENGWSEAKYTGVNGMYVSISQNENLYTTSWVNEKAYIAKSQLANNIYQPLEALPTPVFSSQYNDKHPYISPDESYLIFDSFDRPSEYECNLFISFKNDENNWTEPINMGQYIPQSHASLPIVTPDGKYLFFQDENGDYYWADASFIDSLKPSSETSNRDLVEKTKQAFNYPNPFTENTNIVFELDMPTQISINIINISGVMIESLIQNKIYSSGKHSIELNGIKYANGIYYCTIQSNNSVLARYKLVKISK